MTEKITAQEIVNQRRIILGPQDKLRSISTVKYPWARDVWKIMLENTWQPTEVNLTRDTQEYKSDKLTKGEKLGYDRALAFLSNLDAIQLDNLAENINVWITDPNIKLCIHRQIFEEALHVESYSTLVEAMCDDPLYIYDMYRVNPILQKKNDFILTQANDITTYEFTPERFVYAVVSNIILEGIYFYSGFLTFYTLARMGKMLKSADMIKLIQRDEVVHLNLFVNLYHSLRAEMPEVFTKEVEENCIKLFKNAVELETAWGQHLIEGGILGLTNDIVSDYIKFLADERVTMIGLPKIYNVKNPVAWVDKFSQIQKTEENFFETTVANYSKRQLSFDEDFDFEDN